jgi:hypothetical protein
MLETLSVFNNARASKKLVKSSGLPVLEIVSIKFLINLLKSSKEL